MKTDEQPTPSQSGSNGLTLKLAGQKYSLPIQASTFFGVFLIGAQSFTGFDDIQARVADTDRALIQISQKLDDLNDDVAEQGTTQQRQHDVLEETRRELNALDEKLEALERCHLKPESCSL